MTTAIATDLGTLPGRDTPLFAPHLVVAGYTGPVIRYGDDSWPMAPLIENPSATRGTVHWHTFPETLRAEFRLIGWAVINGELPASFCRDRGTAWRSRTSPQMLGMTIWHWSKFAWWLDQRGLTSLVSCDSEVLEEYGGQVRDSGLARNTVNKHLIALTRLWAFDGLIGCPLGIGRPPWDRDGYDDYLPPESSHGGENVTEEIAAETMGPLLVWAIRMVEDFAGDILTAMAERDRILEAANSNVGTSAGREALDAFLASGKPLPTFLHAGDRRVCSQYLAGTLGASLGQTYHRVRRPGWREALVERPGPCPLTSPVVGEIGNRPWREVIDFNEVLRLFRHLGTAYFIVIAYLTGMRPGELMALRTGCCPDPEPNGDGSIPQHVISGRVFKTARDEHGNHLSAGVEREAPWVAIAPVVHAVRVLERMVPEGKLLFDSVTHDATSRPNQRALGIWTMADRVEDFVTWANQEAASHGRPHEAIPPDPQGRIGTERFRRTLAWHIARRPGGLVALAIQYGHLRTSVSGGYAARSRDGIHHLLDVETARATIDTITDLHEDLEDGVGISGPAARRAIHASATAPQFQGTVITTRTARRILGNSDLAVYDNPNTLLMCVYNRDRALCHRDGVKETPSLDRCVSSCGNIARTDHHADQLRQRATALETRARRLPGPLGERLRGNAARLREIADEHDQTRITLKESAQ
ncbi:integrase [Streptomyces klenkii]|uniref:integrase n=1 Tax=Streptomyces klenkii TaxID=1420899 RepID=UPI0036E29024